MRYRALVAYDGTAYQGWQSQAGNGPTIQETIEGALSTVLRRRVTLAGAGRTDAGVHARGQVIAFDTDAPLEALELLERSVNAVLPRDIAVRSIRSAAPDFDPRRDAIRRAYQYRIWNDRVRSPFEERIAWHVFEPLDEKRMAAAARLLIGEHDFAAFQGADKVPRPSARQVSRSEVARQGPVVTYWVEANAFVRMMVRNIVGQLVEVGAGRSSAEQMSELLESRDRRRVAPPAPPQGLTLEWVVYP